MDRGLYERVKQEEKDKARLIPGRSSMDSLAVALLSIGALLLGVGMLCALAWDYLRG